MKNNLIKKNWQKDAGDVAINAAIRAAGGIGACWAATKWLSYKDATTAEDGKETSETLQNLSGPMLVVLGTLGDLMFADDKIKSFCQGVTTYGALRSIAVINADGTESTWGFKINRKPNTQGVSGVNDAQMFGTQPALGVTAEASELYNGDQPPAEIAEFAAGEQTVNDTDGKTYNNDWAYLAENIDYADQITKSVNGVENAEEAAELMGTDNAEEAALLMGMF